MLNINFFLTVIILIIFSVVVIFFINIYVIPTPTQISDSFNTPVLYQNLKLFELSDVLNSGNNTDKNFIVNYNNAFMTNLPFTKTPFLELGVLKDFDAGIDYGFVFTVLRDGGGDIHTIEMETPPPLVSNRLSFINFLLFFSQNNQPVIESFYNTYSPYLYFFDTNIIYVIPVVSIDLSNFSSPSYKMRFNIANNIMIFENSSYLNRTIKNILPPDTVLTNSKKIGLFF